LVLQRIELSCLEFRDRLGAPGARCTYERRVHELEDRSLADERMCSAGSTSFLDEESLEEVSGAHDATVGCRAVEVRDAGFKVVHEARSCCRKLGFKRLDNLFAKSSGHRKGRSLVGCGGGFLERAPSILR